LKYQPTITSDESSSKDKRLTVLLIDSDGFSDYTCYLARGLSKYLDVILYSFSNESFNITGAAGKKGIKFNYIKKRLPKGYSTMRGIARVLLLFFLLSYALVKTKYDIVHIQDYLPTFFLFIPFLKIRRKQVCWTMHDLEIFYLATGIRGKLQVLFLKLVSQPTILTKYVDSIMVHADDLKEKLISKKVNQSKISVIRFFDYRYLQEFNKFNEQINHNNSQTEEGYVLFMGNIAPWKGIDTLIEAAQIARKKLGDKLKVIIAGTPYEGLKNVQFFKNVKERDFTFIKIINRYIVHSEIPSLLNNSKFLVLPYNNLFQHSASGVIPLAYTFARPVVVSNVPSLVEYVENGKTGLIHEVNDSEQLAKCIIELIENKTKCAEMGQIAYEKLINEMSLDKCSQSTFGIYKKLLYHY
jgi:glycosyltransferase involved in cell wall biosynthesis